MADSARHRGWKYDHSNTRLECFVDGIEGLRLAKSVTGVDVTLLGDTPATNYVKWDASTYELVFAGSSSIDLTAAKVMIDFKDGTASSIDPSATAESGWINVAVDGTTKYIPYYAAS